ncbi:hypothetical protein [Kingella kingae]|uniref:hypothetical protein n=1 Tax=Kingella kingae TaxID=504 RepID=UPI002552160F|nr:hypothetical protein [Kingella kingae]MDK4623734.1 hypothetical protein [Kingella kingae]MDK4659464.1 hypothetical protein [Kingella kingae]MDK4667268.1 hypothetical protein [Kingella kingae]MDK4685778.1 hypothetical protein [Kingella kingae]
MKIMKLIKKYGVGATLGAGLMTVATSSFAGPLAEAVASNTTEFKADLYIVGGIVIGLVVVGIVIGLVLISIFVKLVVNLLLNDGYSDMTESNLDYDDEGNRIDSEGYYVDENGERVTMSDEDFEAYIRENWPEDADRLLKEVEEYQSQGDDNE